MTTEVPRPILELATDLFAREYGHSGPELHRLFGFHTGVLGSYPMEDKPSRWVIFQRGMGALGPTAQAAVLREFVAADTRTDERLEKVRAFLDSGIAPSSRSLVGDLDWERVERSWAEALDLAGEQPAAAIRAARTTFESVCKHICDDRGQPYPTNGDLGDLYKATQRCLVLVPDGMSDQMARQLLSGVGTVLNSVAAMRNQLGDAHGTGLVSPSARPLDARLAVNMAFAVSQYLIDSHRVTPGS